MADAENTVEKNKDYVEADRATKACSRLRLRERARPRGTVACEFQAQDGDLQSCTSSLDVSGCECWRKKCDVGAIACVWWSTGRLGAARQRATRRRRPAQASPWHRGVAGTPTQGIESSADRGGERKIAKLGADRDTPNIGLTEHHGTRESIGSLPGASSVEAGTRESMVRCLVHRVLKQARENRSVRGLLQRVKASPSTATPSIYRSARTGVDRHPELIDRQEDREP